MKKLNTILCASALIVVATQAGAATHNISGSGALIATGATPAFVNTFYGYSGEGTLAGDILSYSYLQVMTNTADPADATMTHHINFTGTIDTTDGSGTTTVVDCTSIGAVNLCSQFDAITGMPQPYAANTYGFTGSDFSWTTQDIGIDTGFGLADSNSSFNATSLDSGTGPSIPWAPATIENPIPTMPIYMLSLATFGLSWIASRRLRTRRKTK